MRIRFSNLRLIIFVAALLFILVLTQSVLEYQSSRKAVEDLMRNQAEALISSVARAAEKGLIAYQIQQRKIAEHLFTLARSIDRLEGDRNLDGSAVERIYGSQNLMMVGKWDERGNFRGSIFSDGKFNWDNGLDSLRLAPILEGQTRELPLGIIESAGDAVRCFAVAVERSAGGAIVAGIDADELLALRRTFGTGSVIDHISQSPEVEYAAIIKDGSILAASRRFPTDATTSWFEKNNGGSDDIITRIRKFDLENPGTVFEISGPFTIAGENYGRILLGINTTYLETLTGKLQRDILWRSILFLIVAVTAVTGVMIKQNYRMLSAKYDEIKREVQKLEADKSQSERLAAMGELAGGVAHEIRNPLNAIRVVIQRLQREFEPAGEKIEYRELTDLLVTETDRINQTVRRFLTMARPPKVNKLRGNVNDCISGVLSLVEPRAAARGCSIEKNLGKIPELEFDPELCKQGILNLLDNALNAVGRNGLVRIRTCRVGGKCRIDIEDNGPGIPDENKYRVFDVYFTTRDTGTGMGLPTVMGIVKEHGGTIELLDSELGGALFRLELPIEN